MIEEWKDIKGYEGLYQVSNLGTVKSKTGRIRKTTFTNSGYELVVLYNNCKSKGFTIHRLVAESFIPNPENKPQVNHIDEDKTNNMVSNLEWVTAKENVNHGTRTLKSSKNVTCIFNDGSAMKFDSLTDCANYLNITVASVSYCINHNKPNKNGIVFYKEVN